jgi:hypothetical protein
MIDVPLKTQIACVRREIMLRATVYQNWVATRRMTADQARDEITAMEAVLETLLTLRAKRDGQAELFSTGPPGGSR